MSTEFDTQSLATISYANLLKKMRATSASVGAASGKTAVRVGVVGNNTLTFLGAPLQFMLNRRGLAGEVFIGDFDSYVSDVLSPDSPLYASQPNVIVLWHDHHSISTILRAGGADVDAQAIIDSQVAQWQTTWAAIRRNSHASIIHTNIALPVERSLGHFESRRAQSLTGILQRLNAALLEVAPEDVILFDTDYLSGLHGKTAWFDGPRWYTSRQPFAFSALPVVSHDLSAVIAASVGKTRKCLVLDLDNTLWGGVVGDDGLDGIRLAVGDSEGEAYLDFQHYCLELQRRGILLAICSKNEHSNAQEPFLKHPEMVLRLEHIAAFVANWDDKASNLRLIAKQLNIDVDSLVFVDDNPAERNWVREQLPQVAVPELPDDPALYARTLDNERFFEVISISADDQQRTKAIQADQMRQLHAKACTSLEEHLQSLDQACEVTPLDAANLARVLQLLNKTNQFNLTTRRFTQSELQDLMQAPNYLTLCARSRDKFGDHGLISVLIASHVGSTLHIHDWVMSCRVFQRGIEDFVFSELVQQATALGIQEICGKFVRTAKNAIAENLFTRYGFTKLANSSADESHWRLDLRKDFRCPVFFIANLNPTSHQQRSAKDVPAAA